MFAFKSPAPDLLMLVEFPTGLELFRLYI